MPASYYALSISRKSHAGASWIFGKVFLGHLNLEQLLLFRGRPQLDILVLPRGEHPRVPLVEDQAIDSLGVVTHELGGLLDTGPLLAEPDLPILKDGVDLTLTGCYCYHLGSGVFDLPNYL